MIGGTLIASIGLNTITRGVCAVRLLAYLGLRGSRRLLSFTLWKIARFTAATYKFRFLMIDPRVRIVYADFRPLAESRTRLF